MEIVNIAGTLKRIGRAVSVMEVEIENQGATDLSIVKEPLDRNGQIVEITEAPAGMGAGVMSWRPDQTKGGLPFAGRLSRQDRPSGSEKGDLVQGRIALHGSDVLSPMSELQVSLGGRPGLHKFEGSLEGSDDRFHPSRSRRGIVAIDLVESRVKNDLH
jgi:hypothetical protein